MSSNKNVYKIKGLVDYSFKITWPVILLVLSYYIIAIGNTQVMNSKSVFAAIMVTIILATTTIVFPSYAQVIKPVPYPVERLIVHKAILLFGVDLPSGKECSTTNCGNGGNGGIAVNGGVANGQAGTTTSNGANGGIAVGKGSNANNGSVAVNGGITGAGCIVAVGHLCVIVSECNTAVTTSVDMLSGTGGESIHDFHH